MTRSEIIAYNAGVADLTAIAEAAADALRAKITEAPTRFNFAIGALDGIVEAAADLLLPPSPDDTEPSTASTPRPLTPASGAKAHISEAEVIHG